MANIDTSDQAHQRRQRLIGIALMCGAVALFAVLDRFPQVRAVLWGHVHQEIDRQRNGVRLLASPSTCIQFAARSEDFQVSEEQPGYRWLRLHADGQVESGFERARDFEVKLDFNSPGY